MTLSTDHSPVNRLRAELGLRAITPTDPEYDRARTVFPGGFDRRPALILRPVDAEEVSLVVATAREAGLPLAVRSGGHSGAGHGVVDDGFVLDLRAMRGLDVDLEERTAWAEAGMSAGEYTEAVAKHGLATGFGDAATVGIGGITLGGGVGYLSRAQGLTIDSVLAAEVVTADGEILEVDEERHPDLFWAIRGGGGNFGVVTRFKYRLHEVGTVLGGILILPATAEIVRETTAAAAAAPDELSAIFNVMPAPPMPFVPADRRGTPVVMGMVCWSGSVEEGERALAPFREIAEPIADTIAPITYPEMYPPQEEEFHPTAVMRTMYVDEIGQAAAETIVERIASSDAPMRVVQIRVLGGAIDRVAAHATAYAHRGAKIMANVASFYAGEAEKAARRAWVDELAGAISTGYEGAYVNFLGDEGEERVRAAYPGATWERLAEVKRRYDPENLFRLNQNVPPR